MGTYIHVFYSLFIYLIDDSAWLQFDVRFGFE